MINHLKNICKKQSILRGKNDIHTKYDKIPLHWLFKRFPSGGKTDKESSHLVGNTYVLWRAL